MGLGSGCRVGRAGRWRAWRDWAVVAGVLVAPPVDMFDQAPRSGRDRHERAYRPVIHTGVGRDNDQRPGPHSFAKPSEQEYALVAAITPPRTTARPGRASRKCGERCRDCGSEIIVSDDDPTPPDDSLGKAYPECYS
jgi:hypothetical protein